MSENISRITIYTKRELKVYIHYPGQLIYSWLRVKNVFVSVSSKSSKVHGSDISGVTHYNIYSITAQVFIVVFKPLQNRQQNDKTLDSCIWDELSFVGNISQQMILDNVMLRNISALKNVTNAIYATNCSIASSEEFLEASISIVPSTKTKFLHKNNG